MTAVLVVPPSSGQPKNHKSPRQIIELLDGAIDKAHKLGDLLLFDSSMSGVEEDGVQVRYERTDAAGPLKLHTAARFLPYFRF
jgi:hypothetical protein